MQDRRLRDHQCLFRLCRLQHDADAHAVIQDSLRIGEHRAQRDAVGARVRLDADEVDAAGLVVARSVDELERGDNGVQVDIRVLASDLDQLTLGDREYDVDRILLYHDCQHAGARADEVAGCDDGIADAAADRALDLRVGEVDAGLTQRCLRQRQICFGACQVGLALIDLRLRRGIRAHQVTAALCLKVGELQGRIRRLNRRLFLLHDSFEWR